MDRRARARITGRERPHAAFRLFPAASRRLDVDSVARRVATSRRQLQRVFAEFGGTSFRRYVAAVRMQRAEELLREGVLPVGEVAQRVGYRQPAQFAKAFRRHRGTAPSALRAVDGARAAQFEDAAAA